MIVFSRPLVLSFAVTHVTTLSAYVWRLLGRGWGVKNYTGTLCSLATFLTTSGVIAVYTKETVRYVGLIVTPMLALLHLRYCVRPAYVDPAGKAVFITGCDSGFGRRLALRLDSLGVHVFAGCQFSVGDGTDYLKAHASPRLQLLQLDITKDDYFERIRKFIKDNLKEDEELWCVVNNAGIYSYFGEIELVPTKFMEAMMNVNYTGTIKITKMCLPMIRKSKGRVVNVTSAAGVVSLPNIGPYSASKFAVEAVSRALRDEMYKWGVSVSVVRPAAYDFAEHKTCTSKFSPKVYVDLLWNEMPEAIRSDYGREYLDGYLKAPSFSFDHEPVEVLDDLEDAIMSKCPQEAYNPGIMPKMALLFDKLLPSCWRRCPRLISLFTFHFKETPAALKKSKTS